MDRKARKFGLALAITTVGIMGHAHAQSPATDLLDLPLDALLDTASLEDLANIIVTDTKTAQARNTVTQSIEVLLEDSIDDSPLPYRNIAGLLRQVSGQFINVLSRNDANWGAYAGLGPKYNSYLLDGLPVDAFVDTMSLDPWAFARIEAHKGPASVLYSNFLTMDFAGNVAPLAGTTNLILKERVDQTLTRIQASYGSYNTRTLRGYHQGRRNSLSYFGGISGERSNYAQYGSRNSWLQTVNDPDYDKLKYYGKVSYALAREDHTLSVFVHHTDHEGDMGRPNRDFSHAYDTLNLLYNNQLTPNLNLQMKLGERRYERQFDNDNFPDGLDLTSVNTTAQRIRPMDITMNLVHSSNALLTVGIDHQQVDYRTRFHAGALTGTENNVHATSRGAYLQEKLQWGDWVLRAGIRHNTITHDYDLLGALVPAARSARWSDNLWSVGLRYNYSESLAIFANAGSSLMAPAAKQIGGTVANPAFDSGQLANPGLGAERGVGQDIGIEWQASPTYMLRARLFRNNVNSAIVDNVIRLIPSQTLASNTANLVATGLELDLRHNASESLEWFANVTLSRTNTDDPGNPEQDATAIPFSPDQVINLGLTWRTPSSLEISAYYHWAGEYFDSTSRRTRTSLGEYGIANMRVQHGVTNPLLRGSSIFVDLNNIGDERHALPFGFEDTGFNAQIGMEYRF